MAVWQAGWIQLAEADVKGRLDSTEALAIPLIIRAIVAERFIVEDDEP